LGGWLKKSAGWFFEKESSFIYFCPKADSLFKVRSPVKLEEMKDFFPSEEWKKLLEDFSNSLDRNSSFDILCGVSFKGHGPDELRIRGKAVNHTKIIGSMLWEEKQGTDEESWKDQLIQYQSDTVMILYTNQKVKILKAGQLPIFNQELFRDPENSLLPEDLYKIIKRNTLKGKEKQNKTYNAKMNHGGKDYFLEISHIYLNNRELLISLRDTTAKQSLLDKRSEKQTMEIMKQFTGGIAHRFNNHLMGIKSTLSLLHSHEISEENSSLLDKIEWFTDKSQTLVERLLGYSLREEQFFKEVDVKKILLELITPLSDEKNLHIDFIVESENTTISGDKERIRSAFSDLIENSQDAMEEGLIQISISTKKLRRQERDLLVHHYKPGEFLSVEIKDNGSGISTKEMKRIFDPFYTTKENSDAFGIGLSSVMGTVVAHQGTLSVKSAPGEGSCFTLYFPMKSENANQEESFYIDKVPADAPVIMLVDDESILLEVMSEILQSEGLQIISFSASTRALEYYKEHYKEIDLLILDMIMPEMDGRDLFIKMKQINPEIKAMILSGYIHQEAQKDLNTLGFLEVMKKPIDRTKLLDILSKYLQFNSQHPLYVPDNINLALKRLGGDKELYRRLINRFSNHYLDTVEELKKYIDIESFKEAYPRAHQLKNQFNIIGFFELAEKMALLEKELNKENPKPYVILDMLQDMNKLLDSIPYSLQEISHRGAEKEPESMRSKPDFEKMEEILKSLKKGLETHHLNAINDSLQELEAFQWPPHYRSKMNRLKRHCDSLQYTLAMKDLYQIEKIGSKT